MSGTTEPDKLTIWQRGYRAGVADARERIRLGHDDPPAPVAAEGTDELREALADRLHEWTAVMYSDDERRQIAAELLAGPLAPLLARLRAVEALVRALDDPASDPDLEESERLGYAWTRDALRRALNGESRG